MIYIPNQAIAIQNSYFTEVRLCINALKMDFRFLVYYQTQRLQDIRNNISL